MKTKSKLNTNNFYVDESWKKTEEMDWIFTQ